MPSIIWRAAFALLFSSSLTGVASLAQRATVCNGHSELCERSYGGITYVGTHNSYAVGVNNLAANQDYGITQQLNDGVRLLQMQAHNRDGVIQLCHTTCTLYNGGTLEAYLRTLKQWLDSNTEEVVTLLIVNIDNLAPSLYAAVFQSAGIESLSYSPETGTLSASSWPTLGSMIDSGRRVVTFLDNQADTSAVPYLIDEFSNIWETTFNVLEPSGFDCSVNRTQGDVTTQMFLINHFLDKLVFGQPAPDVERANVTNAASGEGSLGAHVETCQSIHGRAPNFLLVDWYEYGGGSVFQVAASVNGVTYSPTSAIATPVSTETSATGTESSSATSLNPFSLDDGHLLSGGIIAFGVMFGMTLVS